MHSNCVLWACTMAFQAKIAHYKCQKQSHAVCMKEWDQIKKWDAWAALAAQLLDCIVHGDVRSETQQDWLGTDLKLPEISALLQCRSNPNELLYGKVAGARKRPGRAGGGGG